MCEHAVGEIRIETRSVISLRLPGQDWMDLSPAEARDLLACLQDALGEGDTEYSCASCGGAAANDPGCDGEKGGGTSDVPCWRPKSDAKPAAEPGEVKAEPDIQDCEDCGYLDAHHDCNGCRVVARKWSNWTPKRSTP